MLYLYTDGSGYSGKSSLGVGSWAYCIVFEDKFQFLGMGADYDTTVNRMELSAVINGLKYIKNSEYLKHKKITVVSDSQYVVDNMYFQYPERWEGNGWLNANGADVKHRDLWEEYLKIKRFYKNNKVEIDYMWVKGHSGNTYNEICDSVCGKVRKALIAKIKKG